MKKKKKHALISKKPAEKKKPVIINEDIVTEILLRLPTKSIFKFKCISKTWLKIITDPWFANAYKSFNAVLPVFAGCFCVSPKNHELIFHPLKHCLESPSMNTLPLNLQDLSISSILSSNGLLLLCTTDGRKMVCNPVTGRRLMIPKMKDNTEWYHAFGLIHEKDNHVKVVFAYKLATDDSQTALFLSDLSLDNKPVTRKELEPGKDWLEMLTKWQCRTKNIEFRVYCSKKNEWNQKRLVSKFPCYVCFDPDQMAGVPIGDNLYWITVDGEVLVYNNMIKSEASMTELIGAPAAIKTLDAITIYCSGNEILLYCARDVIMKNVVIIWELMSDQKSWALLRFSVSENKFHLLRQGVDQLRCMSKSSITGTT
ncbi:putative F-box protein At1g47790 [Dioscorea cayenensis subsp. rotundata]|uniref:F-box protein At1g47790 n=1 Tax=Dioscorea cayennensis subsp. rotundata TaxID=55577 RepID=A0AB40ALE0_DIOCR|nr:putative F-box protein At1g47790 [Dioscorea cayenensis subsp. rotundata]